ncbi:MAG: phage tail protein [Proteobacteria bacterium]|nr:phage tail protein [Pseudomonadota bacterium]
MSQFLHRTGYTGIALIMLFGCYDGDASTPTLLVSCWDTTSNATCDVESEDLNGDGTCDVRDCQGPQGDRGPAGKPGKDVTAPVGALIAFAGQEAPSGWMLCDGRELSRVEYAELFAAIGTLHGAGDDMTTFNLPDLRGRFLRGVDHGSGNDPDAVARAMPDGDTGDVVGSLQVDTLQGHRHSHSDPGHSHGYCSVMYTQTGTVGYIALGPESWQCRETDHRLTNIVVTDPIADPWHGTPRTARETRPANVSVNWIIRVKS